MAANLKKKILVLSSAAIMLLNSAITAFAETSLPDGSVRGLPADLIVMDESGASVNESGEYFFLAENMQPLETYTKNVQIMNLRDNQSYHIYMYAEPLSKSGDIDLENECKATLSIGDKEFFSGKVNGIADDGNVMNAENPIDLGLYKPGDSKIMKCSVTWMDVGKGYAIDNGARVIDYNGVHIIREPSGKTYIEGETTFKWVFYAVVDEEDIPPPKTGIPLSNLSLAIINLALIIFIIILTVIANKRKAKGEEKV